METSTLTSAVQRSMHPSSYLFLFCTDSSSSGDLHKIVFLWELVIEWKTIRIYQARRLERVNQKSESMNQNHCAKLSRCLHGWVNWQTSSCVPQPLSGSHREQPVPLTAQRPPLLTALWHCLGAAPLSADASSLSAVVVGCCTSKKHSRLIKCKYQTIDSIL